MKLNKKIWFIILMLIMLPPIGLFLMWRYKPNWNGWVKSLASFIIILVLIGVFFNNSDHSASLSETASLSTNVTTHSIEINPTTDEKVVSPTTIQVPTTTSEPTISEAASASSMKVHFLDVGQGASAIFEIGDKVLIIDGGDRDKSSFVVAYLKKLGVKQVDVMVVTHYDADHLNGLVGVLNVFPVLQVYDANYIVDTRVFNSFKNIINEKKVPEVVPGMKQSIWIGDAKVTFVAPRNYGHYDVNDDSICVRVELRQTSFLIMGDPSADAEQQILSQDLKSDVFVASHHGSNGSNSKTLIANVNPSYVVISCGEGNSYGHPGDNTLNRIRNSTAELYRTDKQGTIICTSDGMKISWDRNPCNDYTPGTATTIETIIPTNGTTTSVTSSNITGPQAYVLNISTKRFHYPYCYSASQISDKNREDITATRDAIISKGFVPCKNCNP